MAVDYQQTLYRRNRPLASTIDRLALLRQSQVNFIPIGNGQTIRTTPLLEDSSINWRERYVEAALIYITNPLCFSAQNLINDELADSRFLVQEKQGTKWKEHIDNPLSQWLQHPNSTMDIEEFIKAYSTHYHTFGCIYAFMFQKGDILPNGKINQEINCFDVVFPARIMEDTVSNPYGIDWYYLPIGYDEPFKLNPKSLFTDVVYNPLAHSLGISLPMNPLKGVFRIHELYMKTFERFLATGAMPRHILTRLIDIQKDAASTSITDEEIEQAVQRVYAKVGSGTARESGLLGLRGDWRMTKVGSALPELVNKDLLHLCEVAVGAVYKIPPSLFWAGMEAGGGRATRQQDSIDFYSNKIRPTRNRITEHLSDFTVPLFIKGKTSEQFRIFADDSESALAQYYYTKLYRMYERWWQIRMINRETVLDWVNADTTAAELSETEKKEYYSGSNNSQGMNVGAGDAGQSVEGGAIGGGGGGTRQPE